MPWTRDQIKAIAASYKKEGRQIPIHVREEMKYYWKHPKKSTKRGK